MPRPSNEKEGRKKGIWDRGTRRMGGEEGEGGKSFEQARAEEEGKWNAPNPASQLRDARNEHVYRS